MAWWTWPVTDQFEICTQRIGNRIFFKEDHAVFEYTENMELVAKHPPDYEPEADK